jgi:hypothetical protein
MTLKTERLATLMGLVATFIAPATVLATSEGWTTDLAAAKKQAGETNRDIFMNFTGSDW